MDIEKLRGEFEEWFMETYPKEKWALTRHHIRGEEYENYLSNNLWIGFQAHAALHESPTDASITEACETLKKYNVWRRGDDMPMESPSVIGKAIDVVVAALQEAKPDGLAERYSDMLRELCCFLSVGGYNSEGLMPPEVANEKIRYGIDALVRGAVGVKAKAVDPDYSNIFNMVISMDVSQCDADNGRRIFGRVEEVMVGINGEHIILAVEESRNFTEDKPALNHEITNKWRDLAKRYDSERMQLRDELAAIKAKPEPAMALQSRVKPIMEQAQVFASSYALIGSHFADDDQLEIASDEKEALRKMIMEIAKPEAAAVTNGAGKPSLCSDSMRKIAGKFFESEDDIVRCCHVMVHAFEDAVPLAAVPMSDSLREKVCLAVAEALGNAVAADEANRACIYGRDDYCTLLSEDSDRVGNIADAAINALLAANGETKAAQAVPDEMAKWLMCKSRRPVLLASLKQQAQELRGMANKAAIAYKQDFLGKPCAYLAQAHSEAAKVFEDRLAQIAIIDAENGEVKL